MREVLCVVLRRLVGGGSYDVRPLLCVTPVMSTSGVLFPFPWWQVWSFARRRCFASQPIAVNDR